MTTEELFNRVGMPSLACLVTMVVVCPVMAMFQDMPDCPQIKPCECLNYYQWEYYSTKRNNILDKLYNGKKSQRKDMNDSLNHYNRLLGLDETLNVYPER